MNFDKMRARQFLLSGDLRNLFVDALGWDKHFDTLEIPVAEAIYRLQALAQKRGMVAWHCPTPGAQLLPDYGKRRKIEHQVAKVTHEHLIVFTDSANETQVWQWVKREPGKPIACREHTFHRSQSGDALLQKLQAIAFTLDEENRLSLIDVTQRARIGFDVERVTKRFYDRFQKEHGTFLKFITGITEHTDHEWYASVMLNRLMFIYFIQRKGFLNGDPDYLRNRLNRMRAEHGKDKFYSFYRYFLLRLFHEGLGGIKRSAELEKLLGRIPYLNGGMFDIHELERPERYGKKINIPDNAFEQIFDYFDEYQWYLDERPLRADNEINPDVLGYIFEKYVNQKQMGAYYTKEDITEYIGKNTILPYLLDTAQANCRVAFEKPQNSTTWGLLRDDPDWYIYKAVRHGVTWNYQANHIHQGELLVKGFELPQEIAAGLNPTTLHQPIGKFSSLNKIETIRLRKHWNKPAPPTHALPTETWREVIERRKHYEEVRSKLSAGDVENSNELIMLNLDIRQFVQDVIQNCEGPDLLRAFWNAIEKVTILDPTCGSGAFLFAALNILEPLYEACLDRMEAFVTENDRVRPKTAEKEISELIASGESKVLEFKSTAHWNVREKKPDKRMEEAVVKTIAAFLNTDGGDLLIGVEDNGSISGIEVDFQAFSKERRNRDFYERWLLTLLGNTCGNQHSANLRVSFAQLSGHDVCRVSVQPSSVAVYVKDGNGNQDKFYIRFGNKTICPNTSETVAYHQQRFTNVSLPTYVRESPQSSIPQKFPDFRKVLANVATHPNRRYFIFKSVILNNLYGVDIMEEAVEICKLRLFLKLVAQVEPDTSKDNLGIEPLPDIDFNIRAGNTLVGYAHLDELKNSMAGNWVRLEALPAIEENAEIANCAFQKFHEMQIEHGIETQELTGAKQELQKRLNALEGDLNRYLAQEYHVDYTSLPQYARWLTSHKPFHWFIEFFKIMTSGGFDVVIGNPPWVEYAKVKKEYTIRNYTTESCGNLHAICTERVFNLLRQHGLVSFIVQLPMMSSSRMSSIRSVVRQRSARLFVISFDDRPGKLFEGLQHCRSVIFIAKGANNVGQTELATTRYQRWATEARSVLFSRLNFTQIYNKPLYPDQFPKYAIFLTESLFQKVKMMADRTVEAFLNRRTTKHFIFYQEATQYWVKATVGLPYYAKNGSVGAPAHGRYLYFNEETIPPAVCALLNSSLFYIYFVAYGDCFHLSNTLVSGFPVIEKFLQDQTLSDLCKRLMRDLKANAERKTITTKDGDKIAYDEFFVSKSKTIVDEIDCVLARYYGFTNEELDFILNYDIKHRMGRDEDGQDE